MRDDVHLEQSERLHIKGADNLEQLWERPPHEIELRGGRYAKEECIGWVVPRWDEHQAHNSAAVWVEAFDLAREHFEGRNFLLILDLTNINEVILYAEGLDDHDPAPAAPPGAARA